MNKCIHCKESKDSDQMLVRKFRGRYIVTGICRACEGERRRARKGTTHTRPKRDPRPMSDNPLRPRGWCPPPTADELARMHQRARGGLYSSPRWGIVIPIVPMEE